MIFQPNTRNPLGVLLELAKDEASEPNLRMMLAHLLVSGIKPETKEELIVVLDTLSEVCTEANITTNISAYIILLSTKEIFNNG